MCLSTTPISTKVQEMEPCVPTCVQQAEKTESENYASRSLHEKEN
uniref:Uncharacterized protein n=1 Tax=Arundo donax TaxID=35708 RepID=A0A0A9B9G4_ARUDO